jgi:hypothetical protein
MTDLIVSDGSVVDGTGAPPRAADVVVADGRIGKIGCVFRWQPIRSRAKAILESSAGLGASGCEASGRIHFRFRSSDFSYTTGGRRGPGQRRLTKARKRPVNSGESARPHPIEAVRAPYSGPASLSEPRRLDPGSDVDGSSEAGFRPSGRAQRMQRSTE